MTTVSHADAPELNPKPKPEKHYLRTAIQEAMALAGGTAWYWIDRDRQVGDWDFPSWSERLTTDVMRYDNNPFHVNFAWHAGNGSMFHLIGRVNGLSLWESVGAGVLSSLTWEYALEYREKVSINDLIFTTGAGIPLGEFIYVMGRFFHEDERASEWAAARWTAGFPQALTRALDGEEALSLTNVGPLWHSMHVGYELGASSATSKGDDVDHTLHSLHLGGRFVRMPGYLETGAWGRGFAKAEFTRAQMDVSGASGGSGFKIFADTTLVGWYGQQVHESREFLSNATMVGVSMAYRYRREQVGGWDDRVGVFHMPGLAADAHLSWRDVTLDTSLRLHADFAGVNALSNDDWEAAHPDEHGKAILRKMGYYYGYGGSVALSAELRYRSILFGGSLWAARYRSDEGLDRTQEDVTLDQESGADLVEGEVHLRVEDLPYGLYWEARLDARERDSYLEEFTSSASLRRLTIGTGISF
ncbi:MAG: DUF3943 domain-containing protein [Myxococcales bacterium]|nr:DUF3943 domain-containing protein [Myxococcales bacterium]